MVAPLSLHSVILVGRGSPAENSKVASGLTLSSAGAAEVERACQLASEAFDQYRALDSETRAKFLETIADRIMALGDELLGQHREVVADLPETHEHAFEHGLV